MTTTPEAAAPPEPDRRTTGIVDCDVHNALVRRGDLKAHLARRWHHAYDEGAASGGPFAGLTLGAKHVPGGSFSLDAFPVEGQAGSSVELMREQLLEPYHVAQAILHPVTDITQVTTFGEAGGAIAAAVNDWMIAEWLEADPRLYGSITVPLEDGERAAREVERVGGHPRFVKVMLTSPTQAPLGHPRYWPIYEAAEALGLPVASHVGGVSGTCTATGWPMFHLEFHVGSYPQAFQAQVASLLHSGVFERFPRLQFVLEEGGIGWLQALRWRLDRTWRAMPGLTPHLERPPSEIVREHFWLTTQPFDEPHAREEVPQLLECLDMTERILFSSDYPHWDMDVPGRVLAASLIGADAHEQIMGGNARRLFGFGEP